MAVIADLLRSPGDIRGVTHSGALGISRSPTAHGAAGDAILSRSHLNRLPYCKVHSP